MRKNLVLKDGTTIRNESLDGKEDTRKFQQFINTLATQGVYLLVEKQVTLKGEKQWLQTQIKAQRF